MSDPSTGDRSRRAVLAACGAGMAALAGCSSVGIGGDGDDEPAYDRGRVDEIARKEVPTRPDAFPVTVTDGMVDRHHDRARELLDAVPPRPTVPNGAITKRLRDMREAVATAVPDPGSDETVDRRGPERLGRPRHVRADAAELLGAYRAATGEMDPEWVADRREGLRSDLRAFEREWTYRGSDPADAMVVHAELEGYRDRVRRSAEAWPPVPDDPVAAPLDVGEIVRRVEAGRATLADATRLRERYLTELEDPRSFRSTMTVAAHRIHRRSSFAGRRIEEYARGGPDDLPFDRSLEGTPAIHFFDELQADVRHEGENANEDRRAGNHARATLASARRLAGVRAFETVFDGIEADKYGTPDDADRVAEARAAALEALQAAWETTPVPLSVDVTYPAHDAFRWGHRKLDGSRGASSSVNEALASFVYARLYAEEVPAVVDTVQNVLA
jgi:hypothetical protein